MPTCITVSLKRQTRLRQDKAPPTFSKKDLAACAKTSKFRPPFQRWRGGGAEPFLAHRSGRNSLEIQKLRRGGQTVRGTVWPWGTLARGSPLPGQKNPISLQPVSYTHLDVYKRQVLVYAISFNLSSNFIK